MPGISPDIICHRLSIDLKTKPVRQKRRSYNAEWYEAMKAEVEKLKGIGFVMNASNMKQSLSICQKDYTNKRTALQ
ncbi:hypothetical protein C1H46_006781 [Malus baccata]|uniref:Uncharacterized protein n=1 Tax=Malus baccata TaxID=106549 RepID=A0A540N9A8_MALBA|nr:hypothetical protein C1H46_006781 [Malus baccata]